jgi:hypothetical protein
MIHNTLRHLASVEHYGIVSLCLFCSLFLGILVWALLQKKSHLHYMSRVVLDDALAAETAQDFEPSPLDPQPSRTSYE